MHGLPAGGLRSDQQFVADIVADMGKFPGKQRGVVKSLCAVDIGLVVLLARGDTEVGEMRAAVVVVVE